MSALSRQRSGAAVIGKSTKIPLTERAGNRARGRIGTPAIRNTPSLPRIRKKKVLSVRQQLAEGGYDLDERLDAAVDGLVATVTT